jgi:hypothetical protein
LCIAKRFVPDVNNPERNRCFNEFLFIVLCFKIDE